MLTIYNKYIFINYIYTSREHDVSYFSIYTYFCIFARSNFVDTYSYYSLNRKNLKIIEWTHAISVADIIVVVIVAVDIASVVHIERIGRVAGIRRF